MTTIFSIVIRSIREIDQFLFSPSNQMDEIRKVEAMRVAYRSMIWTRV